MPRSKARRTMALPFSNISTDPKLCQSPNEMAGNRRPLFPQRLYFIASYRDGEGRYCILIILGLRIKIMKNGWDRLTVTGRKAFLIANCQLPMAKLSPQT